MSSRRFQWSYEGRSFLKKGPRVGFTRFGEVPLFPGVVLENSARIQGQLTEDLRRKYLISNIIFEKDHLQRVDSPGVLEDVSGFLKGF